MFNASNRSLKRLEGVHPLLQACVLLAMRQYASHDFGVGGGCVRTEQEQRQLVLLGNSKTMNSKHLIQSDGFSHAVDLYPSGYKSIEEIPKTAWIDLVHAMKDASSDLGIVLEQGYSWGWDFPHHEIKLIE